MPKINNVDSQDDGLKLPLGLNLDELLKYLHTNGQQQLHTQPPTLLQRTFIQKVHLSSEEKSSFSNYNSSVEILSDVTNGINNLHLKSLCPSTENIDKYHEQQCSFISI